MAEGLLVLSSGWQPRALPHCRAVIISKLNTHAHACLSVCVYMCHECGECIKLGSLSKMAIISDFILKMQRMLSKVIRINLCLLIGHSRLRT